MRSLLIVCVCATAGCWTFRSLDEEPGAPDAASSSDAAGVGDASDASNVGDSSTDPDQSANDTGDLGGSDDLGPVDTGPPPRTDFSCDGAPIFLNVLVDGFNEPPFDSVGLVAHYANPQPEASILWGAPDGTGDWTPHLGTINLAEPANPTGPTVDTFQQLNPDDAPWELTGLGLGPNETGYGVHWMLGAHLCADAGQACFAFLPMPPFQGTCVAQDGVASCTDVTNSLWAIEHVGGYDPFTGQQQYQSTAVYFEDNNMAGLASLVTPWNASDYLGAPLPPPEVGVGWIEPSRGELALVQFAGQASLVHTYNAVQSPRTGMNAKPPQALDLNLPPRLSSIAFLGAHPSIANQDIYALAHQSTDNATHVVLELIGHDRTLNEVTTPQAINMLNDPGTVVAVDLATFQDGLVALVVRDTGTNMLQLTYELFSVDDGQLTNVAECSPQAMLDGTSPLTDLELDTVRVGGSLAVLAAIAHPRDTFHRVTLTGLVWQDFYQR